MKYAEQLRDELYGVVLPDGLPHDCFELLDRLADLIEPTNGFDLDHIAQVCFECLEGCDEPEYTLYDTILAAISRYKRGESGLPSSALVDRDALLALADEIEAVNCPDYGEWDTVVRRIRKALGVQDD